MEPCVDGSPLASGVLVLCLLLVGAAMCSAYDAAFTCAAGHDAFRADRVPTKSSHSRCTGPNDRACRRLCRALASLCAPQSRFANHSRDWG